jgi:hypothetical protein
MLKARIAIENQACTITIMDGTLGLGVIPSKRDSVYALEFTHFTGSSAAEPLAAGLLNPGMMLTQVNDQDLAGMAYLDVREKLKPRPCTLRFDCYTRAMVAVNPLPVQAIGSGEGEMFSTGGLMQVSDEIKKTTKEQARGTCFITIESGSLGINATERFDQDYNLVFQKFTGTSDAEQQTAGALQKGMAVAEVNGQSMRGRAYKEVLGELKHRPCTVVFVDESVVAAAELANRAVESPGAGHMPPPESPVAWRPSEQDRQRDATKLEEQEARERAELLLERKRALEAQREEDNVMLEEMRVKAEEEEREMQELLLERKRALEAQREEDKVMLQEAVAKAQSVAEEKIKWAAETGGCMLFVESGSVGIALLKGGVMFHGSVYAFQFGKFETAGDDTFVRKLTEQGAGTLKEGMVLTHVNDVDQRGLTGEKVSTAMKTRPISLKFQKEASCVITIDVGEVGMAVSDSIDSNYKLQFNYFTGRSDAEQQSKQQSEQQSAGQLQPLWVLKKANGRDLKGLAGDEAKAMMKDRPITLEFCESSANSKNAVKVQRVGCQFTIESGSLGINADSTDDADYKLMFNHFTGTSNAEELAGPELKIGMLLTHVNGESMKGLAYNEVLAKLKPRPCKLKFASVLQLGKISKDFAQMLDSKLQLGKITEVEYAQFAQLESLKNSSLAGSSSAGSSSAASSLAAKEEKQREEQAQKNREREEQADKASALAAQMAEVREEQAQEARKAAADLAAKEEQPQAMDAKQAMEEKQLQQQELQRQAQQQQEAAAEERMLRTSEITLTAGAGAKRATVVTKRRNFRKSVERGVMMYEGYLEKKSKVRDSTRHHEPHHSLTPPSLSRFLFVFLSFSQLGAWQKRWFVVAGHYLKYYMSDARSEKLLAAIDLGQVEISTDETTVRLKLAASKTMQLRACSGEEAKEWAEAMLTSKKGEKLALSKAEEADLMAREAEGRKTKTKATPAAAASQAAASVSMAASASLDKYGEAWMASVADFAQMESEENKKKLAREISKREREEERELYLSVSRQEMANKSVRDAEEEKRAKEAEEQAKKRREEREKELEDQRAKEEATAIASKRAETEARELEEAAGKRMEVRAKQLTDAKAANEKAEATRMKALQDQAERDRVALAAASLRMEERAKKDAEQKVHADREEEQRLAQKTRQDERDVYLSLARNELAAAREQEATIEAATKGLSCKIVIETGSLGIHADESVDRDYKLQFHHFTGKSEAEQQAQGNLKDGMCLTHVNGTDLKGFSFPQVLELVAARPSKLEFKTLMFISAERKLKQGVVTIAEYNELMRVDRADSNLQKQALDDGVDIYGTVEKDRRLDTKGPRAPTKLQASPPLPAVLADKVVVANPSAAEKEHEFDALLSDTGSLGMTFDFQSLHTQQINELLSVKGQAAAAGMLKGDVVIAVGSQLVDEHITDGAFKAMLMNSPRPLAVRVLRPGPNGLVKTQQPEVEENIDPDAIVCKVCEHAQRIFGGCVSSTTTFAAILTITHCTVVS